MSSKRLGVIVDLAAGLALCNLKAHATVDEPIQTEPSIDGMPRAEFEATAKAAMPLPILRLMRWRTPGRNNYAIDMSLAGLANAPPAMHVTFHTRPIHQRSLPTAPPGEPARSTTHFRRSFG